MATEKWLEVYQVSKGKYYSLEEARKDKNLKGFAKEHPSKGNKTLFNKVLERMSKSSAKDDQTSGKE